MTKCDHPKCLSVRIENIETAEKLEEAKRTDFEAKHRFKSNVTGREYPVTPEGDAQMVADNKAYYENQKTKPTIISKDK